MVNKKKAAFLLSKPCIFFFLFCHPPPFKKHMNVEIKTRQKERIDKEMKSEGGCVAYLGGSGIFITITIMNADETGKLTVRQDGRPFNYYM
ncbi:hypothetical protein FKM82_028361 [Ascaphus truei]